MDNAREAVAATGLLVAAIRAEESERADRLFTDPYAERLACDEGRRLLVEAKAASPQTSGRSSSGHGSGTRRILRVNAGGVSQVVILAAGMDARVPPAVAGEHDCLRDRPAAVMERKDKRLTGERSRCRPVVPGVDLADDWPKSLRSPRFNPSAKTGWLVEGLLQYLAASAVDTLFSRIDALSESGSVLLYEVVGQTLLESPFMKPTLQFMEPLGAPWMFAPTRRLHSSRAAAGPPRSPTSPGPETRGIDGSAGRPSGRTRHSPRLLHRGNEGLSQYFAQPLDVDLAG